MKLKSCPFCGLPAKTESHDATFYGKRKMWSAGCGAVGMECDIKPSTQWYNKKSDAIRSWNGRTMSCALYTDFKKSCQALKGRKFELARKK